MALGQLPVLQMPVGPIAIANCSPFEAMAVTCTSPLYCCSQLLPPSAAWKMSPVQPALSSWQPPRLAPATQPSLASAIQEAWSKGLDALMPIGVGCWGGGAEADGNR